MIVHFSSLTATFYLLKPGLDAGFQKGDVVLDNFKQKRMKLLNFPQNPHENEIILAKRWGFSSPTEPPLDPPLEAF